MIKKLSVEHVEQIKNFFVAIFSKEPWNDDWSDKNQLHAYILDLIGQSNSLTLGYFSDNQMIGLAMGRIKHWYSGTEYCIDEFCIARDLQGQGHGSTFIRELEVYCKEIGLVQFFLLTDQNVPAYEFYKKNNFYQLKENVAFAKEFK